MVSRKIRLLNFVIDTGIYSIVMVLFIFLSKNKINVGHIKLISVLFYFLYYFLSEYFWGQTLGKIISKTKVISLNEKKSLPQIVFRTVIRCILLDAFSYLFTKNGFHDRFSKTAVVNYKTN